MTPGVVVLSMQNAIDLNLILIKLLKPNVLVKWANVSLTKLWEGEKKKKKPSFTCQEQTETFPWRAEL